MVPTDLVEHRTALAHWQAELEAITMEVQIQPGQEVEAVEAALNPLMMQPTLVVVALAAATQLEVVEVGALEMEAPPLAVADPVVSVVIPSPVMMQAVAVVHLRMALAAPVEMRDSPGTLV